MLAFELSESMINIIETLIATAVGGLLVIISNYLIHWWNRKQSHVASLRDAYAKWAGHAALCLSIRREQNSLEFAVKINAENSTMERNQTSLHNAIRSKFRLVAEYHALRLAILCLERDKTWRDKFNAVTRAISSAVIGFGKVVPADNKKALAEVEQFMVELSERWEDNK
jgi:hypothetical protein